MKHLTEEDLILHYYGEGDDRVAVYAHFEGCPECRRAYDALERDMSAFDAAGVPERGPEYGRKVWQRLAPRMAARPNRWGAFLAPRRLVAFGSVAALVVAAFLVGRHLPRSVSGPTAEPVSSTTREWNLLQEIAEHLERSQRAVVEVVNAAGAGSVDISAQQAWVEDLIAANRLYRRGAEGAGEPLIAGVLEELERTLVEIANSPAEISAAHLDEIRQRVSDQGILFKLRVVGAQLREREQAAARDRARRTS
jgi:hypothetical protein